MLISDAHDDIKFLRSDISVKLIFSGRFKIMTLENVLAELIFSEKIKNHDFLTIYLKLNIFSRKIQKS